MDGNPPRVQDCLSPVPVGGRPAVSGLRDKLAIGGGRATGLRPTWRDCGGEVFGEIRWSVEVKGGRECHTRHVGHTPQRTRRGSAGNTVPVHHFE
ncbi:hypothetical protein GCM10010216_57600 [Streptomyces flaveolus]|nr:hypothetical protein GCM10010216_57600 [Streptomyces flaveolus]